LKRDVAAGARLKFEELQYGRSTIVLPRERSGLRK